MLKKYHNPAGIILNETLPASDIAWGKNEKKSLFNRKYGVNKPSKKNAYHLNPDSSTGMIFTRSLNGTEGWTRTKSVDEWIDELVVEQK